MLQQEREVLGIDFAVAAVDARLEIASIDDSWIGLLHLNIIYIILFDYGMAPTSFWASLSHTAAK